MADPQKEQYLDALEIYLKELVERGELTLERAQAHMDNAAAMLNQGIWGPNLPAFGEIYGDPEELPWWRRKVPSWLNPLEWFGADWVGETPPPPEWQLGQEAGMPPGYLYWSDILGEGATPSQILDYMKFSQPPDLVPSIDVGALPEPLRDLVGAGLSPSEAIAWLKHAEEAPEEGMTPFEQAQIDRWKFLDEESKKKAELEAEQWEKDFGLEQERLRQEAELRREELLAGLRGPESFIQYWQATEGPESLKPRIRNLTDEAKAHLTAAQNLTGNERLREEMAAEKLFDKADALREKVAAMPKTPPTPSWLPQHLIGDGRVPGVGEPMQRLPIRTPSMQQLAGMTPTARQGLAGVADWTAAGPQREESTFGARTWEDIAGQMRQMLPESPGGGARWQPVRQRA